MASEEERYAALIDRRADDECWPWLGHRHRQGYGQFKHGKPQRVRYAHRFGFFLAHGYYPPAVRHTCDNPPCQNPAHWVPGTQRNNVEDMLERGRECRGERVNSAKLTPARIEEARRRYASGETQIALAREFGVTAQTVRRALQGKTWKWLNR